MKLLKNFMLLLSCLAVAVSCGKGDSPEDTNPPTEVKVKLEASKLQIKADGDDVCIFKVMANEEDVTSKAEIFMNDEKTPLSSKEFKSSVVGNYEFYAVYNGKKSEKITVEVKSDGVVYSGDVTIGVTKDKIIGDGNESTTFMVFIENNKDVTTESKIFMEGSQEPLSNASFSSNNGGEFKFYAVYNGKKSKNVVTITVIKVGATDLPKDPKPESYSFKRKVFAVLFTGTWCGNCPRVLKAVKDIETKNPDVHEKVVFAEAHMSSVGGTDKMQTLEAAQLINFMGVKGFPDLKCDLDKTKSISDFQGMTNTIQLKNMINNFHAREEAKVALSAVVVVVGEDKLEVKIGIKSKERGLFGIGAMLLEDGILESQSNYTPDRTYDYDKHDNVLRTMNNNASDFSGEKLTLAANETITHSISFTVKNNWDVNNMKVAIYAMDSSNQNIVNNVIVCKIGEQIPFGYIE